MTIADQVVEPGIHRFTRAEYERMAADGYFEDQRVELLAGEILDMSPQNHPHAWTISFFNQFLVRSLPTDQYTVRVQLPMIPTEVDEPEPDLAVIRGRLEDMREHPATAAQVVEVANDSLRRDRRKARLYAQAGVEEYWIVNLRAGEIIRHTGPQVGADGKASYTQVDSLPGSASIECTVLPLPARAVKDFFPPV